MTRAKPIIEGTSLLIEPDSFPQPEIDIPAGDGSPQEAVFGGGCFWCVEAVFKPLDGVISLTSGYAGDSKELANYRRVCDGDTNHAEVVKVRFDPKKITFGQLLRVFMSVAHDPTHLNRQGNDVGRQYRSAVFYASEDQRRVSEGFFRQLEAAGAYNAPITTTLEKLDAFYDAEAYHQDYAALNPDQPYIAGVAMPKVKKLRKYFGEKLKK